jgi:hypothetical protein
LARLLDVIVFFKSEKSMRNHIIVTVTVGAVLGGVAILDTAGIGVAQNELQPMQHKSTYDWALVNVFGESKIFVDRNSVEKRGPIVRALVMYSLAPLGTDKRNNKKVAVMLNIEEYDLSAGAFRVQQIVFQYTDGTESAPLSTDLKWKPATEGNQRTLMFLQGLN